MYHTRQTMQRNVYYGVLVVYRGRERLAHAETYLKVRHSNSIPSWSRRLNVRKSPFVSGIFYAYLKY